MRELNIRITADNTDAKAKLGETDQAISGLSGTAEQTEAKFRRLGAAIGSAFAGLQLGRMAGQVANATGQIDDLSKKMGIGTAAVQELKFAAEQGGGSIDQIGNALALMGNKLSGGDASAVAAFQAVGLSIETLQAMSPDQAFTNIATAIAQIQDPMQRSAAAMDIFGRSGAQLLPVLTSDIAGLRQQAIDMGAVLSDELIAKGDALGDTWAAMQTRVDAARTQALMPAMALFLDMPQPLQTAMGLFTEFSGVLTGLGVAVMSVGGPVAAITGIGSALGTVGTVVGAFITGPIALMVAAVAGLTLAWVTWGDDITRVVGQTYAAVKEWLWDKLEPVITPIIPLLESVGRMFTAFSDLVIAVGQKIGTLFIDRVKDDWGRLTTFFDDTIGRIKGWIGGIPDVLLPLLGPIGLVIGAFRHWDQIATIAQAAYTGIKTWLLDRFTGIVDGIRAKVDAVTGFFENMYEAVVGHSFVPDMIDGIGAQFARLGDVMVSPASGATSTTQGLFSSMMSNVTQMLTSGFDGWKQMLGNTLSQMLGSIGGAQGGFSSAFKSLIPGISDINVGGFKIPNPAGKIFTEWFDAFTGPHGNSPEASAEIERQSFLDGAAYLGRTPEEHAAAMGMSGVPFSSGGYGNFGLGTPAVLHGTEAVFPLPPGFDLAASLDNLEGGGGGTTVHVEVHLDARGAYFRNARDSKQLANDMVRQIPDALRRLGVRPA